LPSPHLVALNIPLNATHPQLIGAVNFPSDIAKVVFDAAQPSLTGDVEVNGGFSENLRLSADTARELRYRVGNRTFRDRNRFVPAGRELSSDESNARNRVCLPVHRRRELFKPLIVIPELILLRRVLGVMHTTWRNDGSGCRHVVERR